MTDLVLLSLTHDAPRANPLLDALVEDRQDVWWAQLDPTDDASIAAATAHVEQARAVLVIWSAASVAESAAPFHAIAARALALGRAICVRIDSVDIPPAMAGCSRYDMHGWRARPGGIRKWLGGNLFLRDLLTAARYKVAGRDPPPPGAPRSMLIRQLIAVIPAAFAILALIPTLIGLWNDLGLSNRASAAEAAAWEAIPAKSCRELRAFLATHPGGHYAPQAQARLDGRTVHVERRWEAAKRQLPVYVAEAGATPRPTRAEAIALAQTRAAAESMAACTGLAQTGGARLASVVPPAGEPVCATYGEGTICTLDGQAVCNLIEPRDVEVESCAR